MISEALNPALMTKWEIMVLLACWGLYGLVVVAACVLLSDGYESFKRMEAKRNEDEIK